MFQGYVGIVLDAIMAGQHTPMKGTLHLIRDHTPY